jgi:integrase
MSRIIYRITDEFALVQRNGSTVIYLQWRERGQKVERSTGCRDLEPAKSRAREMILEGAEIRDERPQDVQVMAVIGRYLLQQGPKIASKSSAKAASRLPLGIGDRQLREAWQKAREATGIDCRWHDLRHTCASWLVQAGVPIYTVCEFLGHSSVATTKRYAHLAPTHLQDAIRQVQ